MANDIPRGPAGRRFACIDPGSSWAAPSPSLFGLQKRVARQLRSAIVGVARGIPIVDCLRAHHTVDTEDSPGLLVLNGPDPLLAGDAAFQLFAPHAIALDLVAKKKLTRDELATIFTESIATSWGTLALMGRDNAIWLYPTVRHEPFLDAVSRFWDEWTSVGDRYLFGSTVGKPLWSVPSTLHSVLANRGIGKDTLKPPLPPGGLASWRRRDARTSTP